MVFELARARELIFGTEPGQIRVEVVPGIPALAAAAGLLGAPLTHDFACVSLSDRLTPWPLIEKRLALAAEADFVLVLYNPKSKGRDWQYGRACEIVAGHRSGETPVGIVTRARREGQQVNLTQLKGGRGRGSGHADRGYHRQQPILHLPGAHGHAPGGILKSTEPKNKTGG